MTRIEHEQRTVRRMIEIYCRHKHGRNGHDGGDGLCPECRELLDYAMLRLSRCKFGEGKPACVNCPVHCYKPDNRRRIARVMRHSGPWMLLYHPLMTVRHLCRRRCRQA